MELHTSACKGMQAASHCDDLNRALSEGTVVSLDPIRRFWLRGDREADGRARSQDGEGGDTGPGGAPQDRRGRGNAETTEHPHDRSGSALDRKGSRRLMYVQDPLTGAVQRHPWGSAARWCRRWTAPTRSPCAAECLRPSAEQGANHEQEGNRGLWLSSLLGLPWGDDQGSGSCQRHPGGRGPRSVWNLQSSRFVGNCGRPFL